MKENIYVLIVFSFFLFLAVDTSAQQIKKLDINSLQQSPQRHQKKTGTASKSVPAPAATAPTVTQLRSSHSALSAKVVQVKSDDSNLQFWNSYIDNTEKNLEALDPNSDNFEKNKLKLEKALEKAKLRRALVLQD